MKRVLAALLCLLLAFSMVLMTACSDEVPADPNAGNTPGGEGGNQGGDQSGNQGGTHVHTFKTDAEWSYDANSHWYDATCDCADVTVRKLNHVDDNKDGACDVCKYSDHEHTYAEEWTADCTNHWNAADCGCIVAGANVEAHADTNSDGVCDTCAYVIENLHNHYYSTEWTTDGSYHWHAALCEHGVEVAGKAAHEINAAGYCTVCDTQVKSVDRGDFLAVLSAAVANNYKVTSGNVIAAEIVYNSAVGAATVEIGAKKTNEVYYVLGNGDSYIFYKSFDANDEFIGGDQQWYETISEDEIFGVQMVAGTQDLVPASGGAQFLNGYNYTPGSLLAAGYEDTSTLAQTIYNMYDQMTNGTNVSNVVKNYDAETGIYTFSYTIFIVDAKTTGGEVYEYAVELFDVSVEFRVDDNYVINVADIMVEAYRNWEFDMDLDYDPDNNTVTKLDSASATVYSYNVGQISGERTYTTIYPKASFMPVDFELSYVTGTDYNDAGQQYVASEELITDVDGDGIVDLTLDAEQFVRLHLGNPIPNSALLSFMDTNNFEVTCVNKNPAGSAVLWGTDLMQEPMFSGYMECITFWCKNPGEYTMTIRFGDVTKVIDVTVPGEETIVVPEDTADTIYVKVTENNGWFDEKTFTATASGTYTFTLPAGLGMFGTDSTVPEFDYLDPYADLTVTHDVSVDLAAGESFTFAVGAGTKNQVFAIGVTFVAGEVEGGGDQGGGDQGGEGGEDEEGGIAADISGTYVSGDLTLVIKSDGTMTMTKGDAVNNYTYAIDGDTVTYTLNDNAPYTPSAGMAGYYGYLTFGADGMPNAFVYNGTTYTFSTSGGDIGGGDEGDQGGDTTGDGTESNPYVIPEAGDYTCAFPGGAQPIWYSFTVTEMGYISISSDFNGAWLLFGADPYAYSHTNEGNGNLTNILVAAGTYYIGVGDYAENEANVPFTVGFEAVTSDPIDNVVGTWSGNEVTAWASYSYLFVINADGTGTISMNTGYGITEYTISMVFVDGDTVIINADGSWSSVSFEFTYSTDTLTEVDGALVLTPGSDNFDNGEGGDEGGDEGDDIVVESDPLKALVVGEYNVNGYNFSLYLDEYGSGKYVATIMNDDWSVYLTFTYEVTDNGDGTYTIALTHTATDYDAGTDQLDALLAMNWTVSVDPVKQAVLGTYEFTDYTLWLYRDTTTGAYVANVYLYDYANEVFIDLYFSYTVTDNGNGTKTINLTYVQNELEQGTENLNAVLDYDFTIGEVEGGEGEEGGDNEGDDEVLEGSGSLEDAYVADESNSVAYPGGTDYAFFSYTVAADGTMTITFTGDNFYWMYGDGATTFVEMGTEASATFDVTAGQVIYIGITTADGEAGTVTFTIDAPQPEEPAGPTGTFADPFELQENNSCAFPGGMGYVFYKYTATEAGTLTITVSGDDFYWGYGAGEYALNNVGQVATADIALTAGETIYIGMGTNSGSAGTVDFTASFVAGGGEGDEEEEPTEADGSFANPFELQENNSCAFPGGMGYVFYKYTATEAGTLTITVSGDDFYWGYGAGEYALNNVGQVATADIALTAGETVYIGMSTNSADAGTIEFTASFTAGAAGGEEPVVNETPMAIGNNAINGADVTYAYTADADITLKVELAAILGTLEVTYSVNGNTATALAANSSVEITLVAGDKLVVTSVGNGYSTVIVSEVVEEDEGGSLAGSGTSADPWVIEELPAELVFESAHDKYYTYTATEDCQITITAPSACYVSGIPTTAVTTETGKTYTFTLNAGESVTINPWSNGGTAPYTYTITSTPVTSGDGGEEGGEGSEGSGDADVSDATAVKLVANEAYAASTISGGNLAVAASADEAVTFYLESAGSGLYHIYFLDGGTKTYLNCGISNSSLSTTTDAASATNYSLDETNSHIIVDGAQDWSGQNRVLVYDYTSGTYVFRSKVTGNVNNTSCFAVWYELA